MAAGEMKLIDPEKNKNGAITELFVSAPKQCEIGINGVTYSLNKGKNKLI